MRRNVLERTTKIFMISKLMKRRCWQRSSIKSRLSKTRYSSKLFYSSSINADCFIFVTTLNLINYSIFSRILHINIVINWLCFNFWTFSLLIDLIWRLFMIINLSKSLNNAFLMNKIGKNWSWSLIPLTLLEIKLLLWHHFYSKLRIIMRIGSL